MRWLFFIPTSISLGIFHLILQQTQPLSSPDLMLVLAIYLALNSREYDSTAAIWLLGVLRDLLVSPHLGIFSLLFLGFACYARALRRKINFRSKSSQLLFAFTSFLTLRLLELVLFCLATSTALQLYHPVQILIAGILTAFCCLPLFYIFNYLPLLNLHNKNHLIFSEVRV